MCFRCRTFQKSNLSVPLHSKTTYFFPFSFLNTKLHLSFNIVILTDLRILYQQPCMMDGSIMRLVFTGSNMLALHRDFSMGHGSKLFQIFLGYIEIIEKKVQLGKLKYLGTMLRVTLLAGVSKAATPEESLIFFKCDSSGIS